MLKNLMNKKSKSKGFTLIELIIVVAIIAILAAVAVPKYLEVKAKSTIKSDVSNAKIVYDTTVNLITDDKVTSLGATLEKVDKTNGGTSGKIIANDMDTANLVLKGKTSSGRGDNLFYVKVENGDVKVCDSTGLQIYPDIKSAGNIYSADYTGNYRNPS